MELMRIKMGIVGGNADIARVSYNMKTPEVPDPYQVPVVGVRVKKKIRRALRDESGQVIIEILGGKNK
jgi:hypothetical protein